MRRGSSSSSERTSATLRILPFNARNIPQRPQGGARVSSVRGLVRHLRASPGHPDKPVRLLVDDESGAVLVAKFGLGDDGQRQPCICDELSNLRALRDARLPTPHLATLEWGGKTQEDDLPLPSCVACTEFVRPLGAVHTLRQLAEQGCDEAWRQALFQTLYTLLCLQQAFPGFRHNDLKGDNVLVTKPPRAVATYAVDARKSAEVPASLRLRRAWRLALQAWAKIIDFELACTPSGNEISSRTVRQLRSAGGSSGSQGSLESDYGLSSQRCDLFDVHLLAYDTLNACRGKPLYDAYASFVHAFIPAAFFRPENLTPQGRLRLSDQASLQSQLGPHTLLLMLAHPYFLHLRVDISEVDYESVL